MDDEDQVDTLYATKGKKEMFIDADEKITIPIGDVHSIRPPKL